MAVANGSSGVMTESLSRSRQKWTNEGLFERFWAKPHKRKGVLQEDPNNPPKDCMMKVGTVMVTIEPHIVEATMFAVKTSKLPPELQQRFRPTPQPQPAPTQLAAPNTQAQGQPTTPGQASPAQLGLTRPVLQYGPPAGAMPPPPAPSATAGPSPTTDGTAPTTTAVATTTSTSGSPPANTTTPVAGENTQPAKTAPSPSPETSVPASSSPAEKTANPAQTTSPDAPTSAEKQPLPTKQESPSQSRPPQASPQEFKTTPETAPAFSSGNKPAPAPAKPASTATQPTASPARPGAPAPAAKPTANDPVIALLAQKASGDPELRDLMKRVAVGQAREGELAKFQKIIDQLNAEYRQRGGQQGPSADRLLVEGRTVKYFADEVKTILEIVLNSNPNQKSVDLRPPPRSDPLVVLLVKAALDEQKTRDMIRRIAEGKPGFTDSTDLKQILDKLSREAKAAAAKAPPPGPSPLRAPTMQGPQGQPMYAHGLKPKGPTPSNRPDISAVVFDFGSGDRYLFPKYSILEFLPSQSGQQVIASFLIVRKGSISEYGGDPKLDYYQPVTLRMQTSGGRHLENLARVVAPQDEVRRYMNQVMDTMTRAEYVLLAMRLPREGHDPEQEVPEDSKGSSPTPKSEPDSESLTPKKPGVLWTAGASKPAESSVAIKFSDPEQEAQSKYERLIRAVTEREVDY